MMELRGEWHLHPWYVGEPLVQYYPCFMIASYICACLLLLILMLLVGSVEYLSKL